MRSKRRNHRHVRGISTPRDQNPANSRLIVPSVKRVPFPIEICLEPRVEVHRRWVRSNTDIAKISITKPRWYIEATAKRHCKVREVSANAAAFFHGLGRGPRLARSEEHTSELQSRQYLVCRLL